MYKLYAGPGSPYSHKLRAVFRYRRLPHTWLVPQGTFTGAGDLGADSAEGPLQKANKHVVPVVEYPDGQYKSDSTPIMVELESLHPARSIVPPNAGLAFLAHLIEDMSDEYLPVPMFYFRWTDDQQWCARRQMIGWSGALNDEQLQQRAENFLARQTANLGAAASMPRENVMATYQAFLAAMEHHLQHSLFLFGSRPSFAEFGLYGQLTQYQADPTVGAILKDQAIRVFQWTHFIDDLSGHEGEWAEPAACLTDSLRGILTSLAPGYFFMAQMMRERVGLENLEDSINGAAYRVKCLLALKQELAELPAADRNLIKPFLEAADCWQPLQFVDDEADYVVPIVPG